MDKRSSFIVANWKMNQSIKEIHSFFSEFDQNATQGHQAWIAPQSIHIPLVQTLATKVKVGAQNCSQENNGAFTGEVSPLGLQDLGVAFVIIGHSERRALFNESNELLKNKVLKALENNLTVIYCVGETLEERETGRTQAVIADQLANGMGPIASAFASKIIVAYEPVWAIGTGRTATPAQAQEIHAFIRGRLADLNQLKAESVSILYGGSVKPSNIKELMSCPDIDGALVGGASLTPTSFSALFV